MGPLLQVHEVTTLMARDAGKLLMCDCSFDLADPQAGRETYRAGHIPAAQYVHLDNDLSGEKNGRNGRHPLPDQAQFVQRMQALGASDDTLIVAYDNAAGAFAARLWWLLGWVGHRRRAVLDGGFQAWKDAGLEVETGDRSPVQSGTFSLRPSLVQTVDRRHVLRNLELKEDLLIDARSADRYRGENELLDPKAGHIPGARNRFFQLNLTSEARFKPAEVLRAEFLQLLDGLSPERIVHHCGSGVTACHNVLAMELAGLPAGALYAGSWSEWSQNDGSPIATGPAP